MLRVAALAAVAALSAAGAAQGVVMLDHVGRAAVLSRADAAVAADPAVASAEEGSSGPVASIGKAADGHYWAEASVNGEPVRFLVDTGATTVALTPDDARRLGIDPDGLDYRFQVATAGGQARAAEVRLASVSVGGATVPDVDALVIERGLPTSLLGMTYLGRLSRFEATRTSLILRP
jgi:aspartyl protease family protein